MEIREFTGDIILVIVSVISAVVLVLLLRSDPVIATAAGVLMVAIGGLFLSLHRKIRIMEKNIYNRERMTRVNLEEIATKMSHKYDATMDHIDEVVQEFSKRVYR
jgi:hypothetical protein